MKPNIMNLNWRINETATVLHVAAAIARGLPLSDLRLTQVAAAPVAALQGEILQAGMPSEDAWFALSAYACLHADIGQVVGAALPLTDRIDAGPQQARIAGLIVKIDQVIRAVLPDLGDELRHRIRPLREQWEARGPGLLHSLHGLTEMSPCLEQASVFPVHPIRGGGGAVDPLHAAVRIEALLANTVPGLPEVARLGWLLGQLACHHALDVSCRQPTRQPTRQHCRVIELAMIPVTLAAAEAVELVVCDAATVGQAIAAWQFTPAGEETSTVAEQAQLVWAWWTSRRASMPWNKALVELTVLLDGPASRSE